MMDVFYTHCCQKDEINWNWNLYLIESSASGTTAWLNVQEQHNCFYFACYKRLVHIRRWIQQAIFVNSTCAEWISLYSHAFAWDLGANTWLCSLLDNNDQSSYIMLMWNAGSVLPSKLGTTSGPPENVQMHGQHYPFVNKFLPASVTCQLLLGTPQVSLSSHLKTEQRVYLLEVILTHQQCTNVNHLSVYGDCNCYSHMYATCPKWKVIWRCLYHNTLSTTMPGDVLISYIKKLQKQFRNYAFCCYSYENGWEKAKSFVNPESCSFRICW